MCLGRHSLSVAETAADTRISREAAPGNDHHGVGAQRQCLPPDVLAAQRRERARIRSERQQCWAAHAQRSQIGDLHGHHARQWSMAQLPKDVRSCLRFLPVGQESGRIPAMRGYPVVHLVNDISVGGKCADTVSEYVEVD